MTNKSNLVGLLEDELIRDFINMSSDDDSDLDSSTSDSSTLTQDISLKNFTQIKIINKDGSPLIVSITDHNLPSNEPFFAGKAFYIPYKGILTHQLYRPSIIQVNSKGYYSFEYRLVIGTSEGVKNFDLSLFQDCDYGKEYALLYESKIKRFDLSPKRKEILSFELEDYENPIIILECKYGRVEAKVHENKLDKVGSLDFDSD